MATQNRAEAKNNPASLLDAFSRLGPLWLRWVQNRMREKGISFARLKLLSTLKLSGPTIMNELSEHLMVTPRNVTALVDGLEKEGLVRRRPHPTDRRATLIELTDEGFEGCIRPQEELEQEALTLFDQLSLKDQSNLIRLLTRLHGILAVELAKETRAGDDAPRVDRAAL
jgi:DNA-binding MarR family transcriptional regulator